MKHINLAWVTIPGGPVALEPGGYLREMTELDVSTFAISKYPITNQDFALFVAAGGYQNESFWSADGWRARSTHQWTEPRFWTDYPWNQPLHPVVGVSWYEALAYAGWLSAITGNKITLPHEQQWQRAAQGEDGRHYPWGNTPPEATLCNWGRALDETSPVAQYPRGVSPFGIYDMSGNVWEWCLTGWESGDSSAPAYEKRILRGGCWSNDSAYSLSVNNRSALDPNTKLSPRDRNQVTVGFRCVRNG